MRCDGAKPACQQCARAKKGDLCEYDDGKGKTRTQLLRENIARLEQRVRELEDPSFISPAVVLYDPHSHSRSGSSSSSFSSPGDTPFSGSPFPTDSSPTSPNASWSSLHSIPSPSPFLPDFFFGEQQPLLQPPLELARMLLDIFSPHRRQCGLDIHMGRIIDSLTGPLEEQRHPVLMNAMYMWACFMSRPEALSQHEDHYLGLALDALPEALRNGDKIVDIIQGSCLLSMYFLANGRVLEGGYHASAAAALAVQYGLHLNTPHEPRPWESQESFDTKPSRVGVQEGERILAFWQVYNLDRCWSVILRKPCIIPDSLDPRYSINCPWPQDLADYEVGHLNVEPPSQTIRAFFRGDVSTNEFSSQAIRAKASALFSRADELSITWDSRMKPSATLTQEIQLLEKTIAHFFTTLIPLDQLDSLLAEDKSTLLTVHTLVHTALIQIYRPLASDDPVFFEKCSNAARACVSVVKYINDQDYDFLEPIIGPCWSYAADTLIMELEAQEAVWPLVETDIRNQITTLLYAMTTLSPRLPIVAVAATKLQKRLSEL